MEVVVPAGASGGEKGTCPRAEVVLGDDVGGRAELARELDRVAAADLEAAPLFETAAEGEDAGQ